MAKQHPIKAITNFRSLTPDAVVTKATSIQGTAYNNPNFAGVPAPPIDQPTLKAATDTLAADNAAAVNGGKKEIAQQKHQKEVVVKLLIQLAHWEGRYDDLHFLGLPGKVVQQTDNSSRFHDNGLVYQRA